METNPSNNELQNNLRCLAPVFRDPASYDDNNGRHLDFNLDDHQISNGLTSVCAGIFGESGLNSYDRFQRWYETPYADLLVAGTFSSLPILTSGRSTTLLQPVMLLSAPTMKQHPMESRSAYSILMRQGHCAS